MHNEMVYKPTMMQQVRVWEKYLYGMKHIFIIIALVKRQG